MASALCEIVSSIGGKFSIWKCRFPFRNTSSVSIPVDLAAQKVVGFRRCRSRSLTGTSVGVRLRLTLKDTFPEGCYCGLAHGFVCRRFFIETVYSATRAPISLFFSNYQFQKLDQRLQLQGSGCPMIHHTVLLCLVPRGRSSCVLSSLFLPPVLIRSEIVCLVRRRCLRQVLVERLGARAERRVRCLPHPFLHLPQVHLLG